MSDWTFSVPEVAATAPPAKRVRHKWMKLRVHHYVCLRCATCRRNERRGGGWVAVWFLPDRTQREGSATPPCEPGPATARRLEHYLATNTGSRSSPLQEVAA